MHIQRMPRRSSGRFSSGLSIGQLEIRVHSHRLVWVIAKAFIRITIAPLLSKVALKASVVNLKGTGKDSPA